MLIPPHTYSGPHNLQEVMDEEDQDQDQVQEQEEEEQEEKAEEKRRQIDVQIREKEEADWSIADRAARPDSYLVKAAARAKPTGQKALIPEKEDLDTSELFCGYSVKQLRDLQEADSELKIVKHWV